jgi:V-type H+-transporting ATPase subunit e
MAFGWLAFIIVSAIWGVIGAVLPFFVPKRDDRSIIQLMLILTGICCWLFWLCAYLAQINPLFGPTVASSTLRLINREWQ